MNNADDIFRAFVESQALIAKIRPTHCGEISFKMRKGAEEIIETVDSYYTASGTEAIVRDKRDGQEYIIEVKPLKRNNERETVDESKKD